MLNNTLFCKNFPNVCTHSYKSKINENKSFSIIVQKKETFIKQLIDSDFIYSRKEVNKRLPSTIRSVLNLSVPNKEYDNKNICTLDIFQLNKSLKQFLKILELLKSTEKIQLFVVCTNKHFLRLIDRMIKRYSLKNLIKTSLLLPDFSHKSYKDQTKFLFVLGDYPFTQSALSQLIYYRVSLVNKFNLNYERKTQGFYKIQNNLDDYKKVLLILILIEKVLGKKNKSINTN